MKQYLMALDQGTTSSRCILFDRNGKIVSLAQKEFKQYYPQAGWVEHNPMEIWSTQMGVAREAMEQINVSYEDIAALGITNQRETTILWDRYTGEPIYPAIVWQCRRTAEVCEALEKKGYGDTIFKKTGLRIDAYFSATKIQWILEHVEGAKERAERGDILFGTVDTWLIWKLTKGKVHATDYTNAARTMLFNIVEKQWDEEILTLLGIPKQILPEVHDSSCLYGETESSIFGGSIPIAGVAGDQQASLFGQACFERGEVKNTYGTGGFLLMNVGAEPVFSEHGLLTTIAWGLDGMITYALEGSVFVAGAAIQWLRDEMGLISTAAESEEIAKTVPDTNGVYMVPAFVGLGAPYWDPYARGILTGLTRGANRKHIVRAVLEALAYQTYDVVRLMERDAGIEKLPCLKVDGGASANNFLMQFQSDMLQSEIQRPQCIETTALGAAYLAGLGVGFYKNVEEIKGNWQMERIFKPEMNVQQQEERIQGWKHAVKQAMLKEVNRKRPAVIFDLDGTLLNTLGDLHNAVNFALEQYGYPKKDIEAVRMAVGNGVGTLIERVVPKGKEDQNYQNCLDAFRTYYSQHMQDVTVLYAGIQELLQTLKKEGYQLGIVSNKFDAAVKQLKEDYFADTISVAIGESDGVRKKPSPDCVFKAMEELQCTKEDTIYVGDSDVDVETAHNAGLRCVGVTWGFRDEALLVETGADWIIHTPEELLEILNKFNND